MDFAEAIQFGVEALRANKLRTFLTALGLIIGNASVILVVTISLASQDMILNTIRGIGSNLVYANYETEGQNTAKVAGDFVKISDVNALREDLGDLIVAATAVMPNHDQIVVNGQVREVTVDGVDAEYAKVRNLVILSGRSFVQSDITFRERVGLVSQQLATRLFGGQEAALGQTVKINQLQFTVIGTFREKTSTFGQGEITDETILIPISVMKDFEQYERVEPVYLEARTPADVPIVRERVADPGEKTPSGGQICCSGSAGILGCCESDCDGALDRFGDRIGDCFGHLRNRHYEHHAGYRDGTDSGDWIAHGFGSIAEPGHAAVSGRSGDDQCRRRRR